MIDKSAAVSTLLGRLGNLPEGHCLEIRTYKRNRRVLFRREASDSWSALQEGFERNLHQGIARDKLRKLLQSLLRKEFPRSVKIRVYARGPCSPEEMQGPGPIERGT